MSSSSAVVGPVQRTRPHHLRWMASRWALSVCGGLALILLMGAPAFAIPWPIVNPFPPPQNGWGGVTVNILNQTPQSITLTAATNNDKDCAGANTWVNSAGVGSGGTSQPLPPGESGQVQMETHVCNGETGTIEPSSGDGAFSLGLYGAAQFEFAIDWSFNGNFNDFHFEQGYTGGGDTGGLYQYNCGNGQLIGSGNGGPGGGYEYANETTVCFVAETGSYQDPITSTAEMHSRAWPVLASRPVTGPRQPGLSGLGPGFGTGLHHRPQNI